MKPKHRRAEERKARKAVDAARARETILGREKAPTSTGALLPLRYAVRASISDCRFVNRGERAAIHVDMSRGVAISRCSFPGRSAAAAIRVANSHEVMICDCVSAEAPLLEVEGAVHVEIRNSIDRGEMIAHRVIERTNSENAFSHVITDRGGHSSVTAIEFRNARKCGEESDAGSRFTSTWNDVNGTVYRWKHEPDTSHFEDGWMLSSVQGEPPIPLQLTHLEAGLKAAVSRDGFVYEHSLAQVEEAVKEAIQRKDLKGADAKKDTILVLITAVPLGFTVEDSLSAMRVDFCGYRAVWICPAGARGFPLQSVA